MPYKYIWCIPIVCLVRDDDDGRSESETSRVPYLHVTWTSVDNPVGKVQREREFSVRKLSIITRRLFNSFSGKMPNTNRRIIYLGSVLFYKSCNGCRITQSALSNENLHIYYIYDGMFIFLVSRRVDLNS